MKPDFTRAMCLEESVFFVCERDTWWLASIIQVKNPRAIRKSQGSNKLLLALLEYQDQWIWMRRGKIWKYDLNPSLGGGFKYFFYFHLYLGTNIFQGGWNHQPDPHFFYEKNFHLFHRLSHGEDRDPDSGKKRTFCFSSAWRYRVTSLRRDNGAPRAAKIRLFWDSFHMSGRGNDGIGG